MTDALFLAPLDGAGVGDVVLVDGDEGRHAVTVRRIRVGERVFVADGAGLGVHGEVLSADKAGLRVRVERVLPVEQARPHVCVAQALAKGGRDEQAIEAMTELGVAEVIPWRAARCVVRWEDGPRADKQLAKWRSTVREAAKQSRRRLVPTVTPVLGTAELARTVAQGGVTFVLHEGATAWLAEQPIPAEGRVMLVVGPEGGIGPEELTALTDAGAVAVRVAEHVLRTSTAGLVALAQLQALRRADAPGHDG